MTAFCVWYVYVYLTVSVCGAFINMPLFELHACVWNYHIVLITNTNVVANKPPICENKGCYYWKNNNKHTLFSQKNKDKSNEVTWDFLNRISRWCSIRFPPAFSTLAILPVPHFLLSHFQSPRSSPSNTRLWSGQHAGGHCSKGLRIQRSKVKVVETQCTFAADVYISTVWRTSRLSWFWPETATDRNIRYVCTELILVQWLKDNRCPVHSLHWLMTFLCKQPATADDAVRVHRLARLFDVWYRPQKRFTDRKILPQEWRLVAVRPSTLTAGCV